MMRIFEWMEALLSPPHDHKIEPWRAVLRLVAALVVLLLLWVVLPWLLNVRITQQHHVPRVARQFHADGLACAQHGTTT